MGWEMGLEPTTPGITIRCSNQLSYTHRGRGENTGVYRLVNHGGLLDKQWGIPVEWPSLWSV